MELSGGFLDGGRFEFDRSFNCIIGGRGTGKTTLLEVLRFVLDRMPDTELERGRHRAIELLLKNNLGSARVEIETVDGTRYSVVRGFGDSPLITNDAGVPVDFDLGKDIVFGVDIYSQNQIEEIANDAFFQLQLIDKFIQLEVDELERRIRATMRELEGNATRILECRKSMGDLTEATRQLPDVAEKIRGLNQAGEGEGGDLLRREFELKSLRASELQLMGSIRDLYDDGVGAIEALLDRLKQQPQEEIASDLETLPNRAIVGRVQERGQTVIETVQTMLATAKDLMTRAGDDLLAPTIELQAAHALQEKQYRDLVDKHEKERVKGVERTRLEQRHADLKAKETKLQEGTLTLAALGQERELMRAQLSNLRDERYRVRLGVADRLNSHLSPMIRVRVQQFGNMEEYRTLLNRSMKGSGLRYASIVDRVIERIPPAELASLIQRQDAATLARELDLDVDRATRLIIQLKDKPEIFEIESVELHDRPILELKDGPDYKDSTSLSTGQKCTTILPILLMESERPLLIDQPEDNLDNAFIFETIVKSIAEVRGQRQLIFVTHNPNIPVLGDAARVFCLRSTGRSATVESAGSVDDVATQIMRILEGGHAAFEARRRRYGRPIPETDGT